jgi:pimeloyl-ACP methyl ester carboxylesterase
MAHATINGARLWYDVQGDGEPLLLHHGYTASRVNWEPAAALLRDRYQVILMECRGTGDSEHTPDGYSLEQYAADVIGMADHLGLARFSFAGHSMGGGIGYVLALEHAERIERLILMASVPADGYPLPDQDARDFLVDRRRRGDRDSYMAEYVATRFRADVETDAWFNSRIDHILAVSEGHYVQGAESFAQLRVGDRLVDLSAPTLVLAGAVDSLLAANLADFNRLPNATLQVFSRAGHEVAVHEPEGVAAAIDGFMRHGAVTADSLAQRRAGRDNGADELS